MLNYEKKTTGILILSDAKVVYSDNYVKLREFTPPKNCTACAVNLYRNGKNINIETKMFLKIQ